MMEGYPFESHVIEMRTRTQLAAERAQLVASLGPIPAPERIVPFRRRVVRLPGVVNLAANGAGAWPEGPQAA